MNKRVMKKMLKDVIKHFTYAYPLYKDKYQYDFNGHPVTNTKQIYKLYRKFTKRTNCKVYMYGYCTVEEELNSIK